MLFTGLFILTSYRIQGWSTHNGLGPHTSIANYENSLQACPQPDLTQAFLTLGSLFSGTLKCVKLVKLTGILKRGPDQPTFLRDSFCTVQLKTQDETEAEAACYEPLAPFWKEP